MKSDNKFYKYLIGVVTATGLILLIPLIAMQFTNEVVWSLTDFIIAGIMLFGTGTAFVFTITRKQSNTYKTGMVIAVISAFLLFWVNGAVGIVGHEGESINLLYFGAIALGLIGSFISRFKSHGMCYTMSSVVISILVITVLALMGVMQEPPHNSSTQIIGINAFFAVLFLLSAISFRNASLDDQEIKATA